MTSPQATVHPVTDPERLAEPAQSVGSMFMGSIWFKLAVLAPDRVAVRGGGWCQGYPRFSDLDHWTEHPSREEAVSFVRRRALEFLYTDPPQPLDPAQRKCRDELLAKLDGPLDTRYWAQPLTLPPLPPTPPSLPHRLPPLYGEIERDPTQPNRLGLRLDSWTFEVTRTADGSKLTFDLLTNDHRFAHKSWAVEDGDLVPDPDEEG